MPKRNWVNDITFGCLAAGIFVAVSTLCVHIVVSDYAKVEEVYAGYQRNADHDKQEADQRIKSSCVNVSPDATASCIANELHAYYSNQATNADLQAQQDMAIWAKWMFITSMAGIAVGVIGIFYVRSTFHEARETTLAAVEAVNIAREANRVQLRPYVFLVDSSTNEERPFQRGDSLPFGIKNFGQTPALNLKIQVQTDIVRRPIGNHIVRLTDSGESYGVLGPGAAIADKIYNDLSLDEISRVSKGEVMLTRVRIVYDFQGGGSDEHDLTFIMDETGLKTSHMGLLSLWQRNKA